MPTLQYILNRLPGKIASVCLISVISPTTATQRADEPQLEALHSAKIVCVLLMLAIASALLSSPTMAQQSLESGEVSPMGQWLEYRESTFNGAPILVHLRTGYERAVILPEPVAPSGQPRTLPGAEIVVDGNIVAFYPTRTFDRLPLLFVGQETGTVYELRVRASTEGIRQPLRINRP